MTTNTTPLKHLGFASIPAVKQYLRAAADLGIDFKPALAEANIPESLLEKENERVTGEQFQTLLKTLIVNSKEPLLGLKSGQYVQPGSYNVLGYITMSCATVKEAMAQIIPYEKLVGDMGVTTIEKVGDHHQIIWHCAYTDETVRRHMIENVLYSWTNYTHWLADADIPPVEICFEHALPANELLGPYEAAFKCPVRFEQPISCIVIDNRYLDYPLRQPDPSLKRTLEDHAKIRMSSLSEPDTRLVTRVKSAIRQKLNEGITRKDMVAELLELTTRTLQRKLATEGLSYQELLDEVREELAKHYLKDSSLSLQEIAMRTGFSEARSFHRSFKSWTGKTPGDFRDSTKSSP